MRWVYFIDGSNQLLRSHSIHFCDWIAFSFSYSLERKECSVTTMKNDRTFLVDVLISRVYTETSIKKYSKPKCCITKTFGLERTKSITLCSRTNPQASCGAFTVFVVDVVEWSFKMLVVHINLTPFIIQCTVLLDALGVPWVQSPGEAEALCAFLNSYGVSNNTCKRVKGISSHFPSWLNAARDTFLRTVGGGIMRITTGPMKLPAVSAVRS